jgi:hypothetical protein
LAIAALMVAVSHTGTKLSASPLTGTVTAKTLLIPSRAASSASSGMTDSLAISQIPDSTAVVQDPLKASSPAKPGASGDAGSSSSGSASTSGIPPAGAGSGTAPVASTPTSADAGSDRRRDRPCHQRHGHGRGLEGQLH